VERIEAAVGELLASLGYRLKFARCSSAACEQVAQLREIFACNALANWRGTSHKRDMQRIEAVVGEMLAGH